MILFTACERLQHCLLGSSVLVPLQTADMQSGYILNCLYFTPYLKLLLLQL